jgi:hypothetical protein
MRRTLPSAGPQGPSTCGSGVELLPSPSVSIDGRPGEVFIDGGKTGQDIQGTARDAAVVLSLALQHGTPIETIRHAVTRGGSGEAASILGAIIDMLPATARGAA